MTPKTQKKPNVDDIKNLLGHLSAKRDSGELPKTEVQFVQPLASNSTQERENGITEKSNNEKTEIPENVKTFSQEKGKTDKRERVKTGRPTAKSKDIEYVRLGAVIPKTVKQKMVDALNYEIFQLEDGQPVRTVDEIVTIALEQLLNTKTKK
jgi:hypothetical protein